MKEEIKNQWRKTILEKTKIDPKYHDKVLSYLEMYIVNESLYGHVSEPISRAHWEDLWEKVMPLSLLVLEQIDMDKVEFTAYPTDTDSFRVITDDNDEHIVNEIVSVINGKINEGYNVKIYKAIQSIMKDGNDVEVMFRMGFYKNN